VAPFEDLLRAAFYTVIAGSEFCKELKILLALRRTLWTYYVLHYRNPYRKSRCIKLYTLN